MTRWAIPTLFAFICIVLGACTEPLDFGTVIPTGRLVVEVTDTANAPVPNVAIALLLTETNSVWRTGRTDASGKAEIGADDGGVLTGDYLVRLTVPSGYRIPETDPHPVPVRIITNGTVIVPITLTQISSQAPPAN